MFEMLATLLPTLAVDWVEVERDFEEGFGLMVVGMGIVFVALVVIGQVIRWLGVLLGGMERAAEARAAAAAAAPPPPPVAASEGFDPHTVVVLTAAAAAVLRRPVRVRRITYLNQNTVSAWTDAGRLNIHSSHNIRR